MRTESEAAPIPRVRPGDRVTVKPGPDRRFRTGPEYLVREVIPPDGEPPALARIYLPSAPEAAGHLIGTWRLTVLEAAR